MVMYTTVFRAMSHRASSKSRHNSRRSLAIATAAIGFAIGVVFSLFLCIVATDGTGPMVEKLTECIITVEIKRANLTLDDCEFGQIQV